MLQLEQSIGTILPTGLYVYLNHNLHKLHMYFLFQLFSLERVQYKLKGNWMMIMSQVGASIEQSVGTISLQDAGVIPS